MKNNLESKEFNNICIENLKNVLNFLIKTQTRFQMLVDVEKMNFTPELPNELKEEVLHNKPVIILDIANYGLESMVLYDDKLRFETGLGRDNIGVIIEIQLSGVLNLLEGQDKVLYINAYETYYYEEEKEEDTQEELNPLIQNSIKNFDKDN